VLQRCRAALRSSLVFYLGFLGFAACALLWLRLPGVGVAAVGALANGSGLLILSVLLGQGRVPGVDAERRKPEKLCRASLGGTPLKRPRWTL
jgi:hypothetical protein